MLRYVSDARFDDGESGRVECTAYTRREVLSAIRYWIQPDIEKEATPPDPDSQIPVKLLILWLYGLPGCGKSTVAHTVARWCDRMQYLGASFFCARTGGRSNVHRIFPTIAYQLSLSNPTFANEVIKALSANPDVYRSQPSDQLEKLIVEPLKAMKGASFLPKVVIIDALDECDDKEAVSVILIALSKFVADLRPLKFLITSRPESRIVKGFRYKSLLENTHPFPLSEVSPEIVEHDMAVYMEEELKKIREYYSEEESWPTNSEKKRLIFLAHGLFIFLATALKFIADLKGNNPRARLVVVLQMLGIRKGSPLAYLYGLYVGVFDDVIADDADPEMVAELKLIVGSVVLLRDQLPPSALDSLLGVRNGTATRNLELLRSVVSLPQSSSGVIQIIHPSFPDFLTDPTRCTKPELVVHPQRHHNVLARRCLETMVHMLHKNVCQIPLAQVSFPNKDVPDLAARIRIHLPSHVQYAVRHWAHHLHGSEIDTESFELLKTFCNKHLLHWLECLSLVGDADIAIKALQVARQTLTVCTTPTRFSSIASCTELHLSILDDLLEHHA